MSMIGHFIAAIEASKRDRSYMLSSEQNDAVRKVFATVTSSFPRKKTDLSEEGQARFLKKLVETPEILQHIAGCDGGAEVAAYVRTAVSHACTDDMRWRDKGARSVRRREQRFESKVREAAQADGVGGFGADGKPYSAIRRFEPQRSLDTRTHCSEKFDQLPSGSGKVYSAPFRVSQLLLEDLAECGFGRSGAGAPTQLAGSIRNHKLLDRMQFWIKTAVITSSDGDLDALPIPERYGEEYRHLVLMGRVDRVEAAEEIIENLSVLAHGIDKRVREFSDRQISRRDRQKLKQLIGTLTEMSARGN